MVMPRLLIVENERIIARDLAKRLTTLGYTDDAGSTHGGCRLVASQSADPP
jgi:hypothetical protein